MDTIIILDRVSTKRLAYNYILRADVPAARQSFYADPDATSAYPSADATVNDAIKAGQIVERQGTLKPPLGATPAQLAQYLVAAQQDYQAEINSEVKFDRYGTSYDGTSWTSAGA